MSNVEVHRRSLYNTPLFHPSLPAAGTLGSKAAQPRKQPVSIPPLSLSNSQAGRLPFPLPGLMETKANGYDDDGFDGETTYCS